MISSYIFVYNSEHSFFCMYLFIDLFKCFDKFFYWKADEIFSEIDPKPLGAASLAQVHKGKLRSTGENVAIKVQHSYVRGDAKIDIAIIEVLFTLNYDFYF